MVAELKTVEEIKAAIEAAVPGAGVEFVPNPSPSAQHSLRLAPESAVYNVNFAARIRSDVNVPALRRALQALVDRHPSLRTTFPGRLGKPVQQVHQHLQVHFDQVDGSSWSEAELKNWLLAEAYRPFDLERGPLLRVSLIMRSANEHILLMVVHHIVIDFWSLAVLLNELGVLYPAQCAGVQASLPALDLQYTDYVRWQAELLAGAEGERLWHTGKGNWPVNYRCWIYRPIGHVHRRKPIGAPRTTSRSTMN